VKLGEYEQNIGLKYGSPYRRPMAADNEAESPAPERADG
jgi:hypothetical protein